MNQAPTEDKKCGIDESDPHDVIIRRDQILWIRGVTFDSNSLFH